MKNVTSYKMTPAGVKKENPVKRFEQTVLFPVTSPASKTPEVTLKGSSKVKEKSGAAFAKSFSVIPEKLASSALAKKAAAVHKAEPKKAEIVKMEKAPALPPLKGASKVKIKLKNAPPKKKPNVGPIVAPRFAKKDFVTLMTEASKYPLSMRIAAELFRGHVTGARFLKDFHIEKNSFSASVLEEITKFDLKKGYDPKNIPPVLPVYTKYVGAAQQKEEALLAKMGRPNSEEAKEYLTKVLQSCLKRGWDEVDFINTLREMVEPETEARKMNIELDEESSGSPAEALAFVQLGKKWEKFPNKKAAEKAMREHSKTQKEAEKVESAEKVIPFEPVAAGTLCSYCQFALNGTTVSIRRDEKTIDHMHMGCYWMNEAHASQIPEGMRVLSALEGISYQYNATSRWTKVNEKANPGTKNSQGVPPPAGPKDQPPEALPPEKAA